MTLESPHQVSVNPLHVVCQLLQQGLLGELVALHMVQHVILLLQCQSLPSTIDTSKIENADFKGQTEFSLPIVPATSAFAIMILQTSAQFIEANFHPFGQLNWTPEMRRTFQDIAFLLQNIDQASLRP